MFLLLWHSTIVAHDHNNVPDVSPLESRDDLRFLPDEDEDMLMLWWAVNEYQ